MKRTLLIISLIFIGFSSKGQNLTFVDANNLVVNSSNWTNYWKPNTGEIWKIEGINGTTWSTSSTYTQVWVNSAEITNGILFPLWIGSSDSIKIRPYGNSSGPAPGETAIINYLIFKNEP